MRRRKADLSARVNGNLTLRFTAKALTSYAGLELFRQFLDNLDFSNRLRRHLRQCDPGGDFSSVSMVRLLIAMFIVGASRPRHARYLVGDPIIHRFCNLKILPTARTLGRWLSRGKAGVQAALLSFNMELVALTIAPLRLRRLTLDIDGTVISTGLKVERAFRGFNPHHRKVPSYYPITAYLAQTGHLLWVQNRSGNVHDGKASQAFLRELFDKVHGVEPNATLEVRMDGAFFRREIINWLESRAEYAIKVPFYKWVDLQSLIRQRQRWKHIRPGLQGFETSIWLEPWKRSLQVAIYRKRVKHRSMKNYQLDLFDPSDGHWEYSAITTNKRVRLKTLWDFMAGRGAHEKALAELKSGYAFDSVPTLNYAGNSMWQILSVLAHNLMTSFQIDIGAPRRKKTAKRSPLFLLKSIRTLRYELLGRAGILQRPGGRLTLTLSKNLPTRQLFENIERKLGKAG
jgi:hypothetical protein